MDLLITIFAIGITLAGWVALKGSANGDIGGSVTPDPFAFTPAPLMPDDFTAMPSADQNLDWTNPAVNWQHDSYDINPANGLPMMGGMAGLDIAGNTYGVDSTHDFSTSSFDDSSYSCDGSSFGGCGGFSEW